MLKLRQQLTNQIDRFFFEIRKLHVENDEAYLITTIWRNCQI